jgi:hypothetical protein
MKKATHLLFLIAAAISFSFVSDSGCGDFEQFHSGTVFTMTSYNGKGKVTSVTTSTVKNITNKADGLDADIHANMVDEKQKQLADMDYTLSCAGGEYRMDMKSFAGAAGSPASKDITMTFEGNTLDYPKTMTAGQTLKDGQVVIKSFSNGSLVNTTTVKIYNRKVEALESKTTPAGTWECYKISYTTDISMEIGGMKMPIKPRQSTEWFSFKVGTVRTETYKGDGLEGYSELTSLKKP